jgi:hypothetical protein
MGIAPLICDCVNQNQRCLEELLKSCNEIQLQDDDLAKLIHDTVVCNESCPLKLLSAIDIN